MRDCYQFYVTDQEISFDIIFKCVCDFLEKERQSNECFNNINFTILECKNACLIQFSYRDTKRDNILNARIFKNPADHPHIRGNKSKVFGLIFGLLKEAVERHEFSRGKINDIFNQFLVMGAPIKWK